MKTSNGVQTIQKILEKREKSREISFDDAMKKASELNLET